ncbi:isoprenylcysteine carboxylmethyltransferase family protein [Photobacterium damselae]
MSLKVPPPIWLLLALVSMALVSHYAPLGYFDFPLKNAVVIAICFIGSIPGFSAVYLFSKAKTTLDPRNPKRTSQLVTSGIYQFTRNPMYLSLALYLLATAIYLETYSPFLVLPVFIGLLSYLQIAPEEEVLRAMFGQEYSEYCKKVRRWC